MSRFRKIGVVSLISILFVVYLISKNYNKIKNHFELSEKRKSKLNSSEIKIKLNFTFEYNENNTIHIKKRIWGEPDLGLLSKTEEETFGIMKLPQFPSGNFIAYDYTLIVIYDKFFNIIQTISPFADEFGKYTYHSIMDKIVKILIKDENNFILLAEWGIIKFYKKEGKNFIFKNEIKIKKLVSDITFDKSKEKLFSFSQGFIKIFQDINNDSFSEIKEITAPELPLLVHVYGPYDNYGDEYNKILLLEDKNILIVKEQNSISFFNISENYKLINIYKEKDIFSDIISIDRYDEGTIIGIYNFNSLKVISINGNKVLKYVKEINKEKIELRIIKTYPEKNIIILGGTLYIPNSYIAIIQILRLDNLEIIQTIKLPQYYWILGIYFLKNDLIATIFDKGVRLWNI